MTNPAEMPNPEETGGGTGQFRIPKEIPYELPPYFVTNVINEIIAVRNRLHAYETAAIVARFGGFGGFGGGIIGGPNELPNPDDPGSGGGGGFEIPYEIPREIPEDLPAIEKLIDERVNNLRQEILGQLAEIKQIVASRG
jgi:hypothetical protein